MSGRVATVAEAQALLDEFAVKKWELCSEGAYARKVVEQAETIANLTADNARLYERTNQAISQADSLEVIANRRAGLRNELELALFGEILPVQADGGEAVMRRALERLQMDAAELLAAQAREAMLRKALGLDLVTALKVARSGMTTWAAQPGNRRWWKRIDGTPIPNDLMVFVSEAFIAHTRTALADAPLQGAGVEG